MAANRSELAMVPYRQFLLKPAEQRIAHILDIVFADLRELLAGTSFDQCATMLRPIAEELLKDHWNTYFTLLDNHHHDKTTVLHSVGVAVLLLHTTLFIEQHFPLYYYLGSRTDFFLAGLLHDVGKKNMLDIIRKNGKPSAAEYLRIQQHPTDGVALIEATGAPVSASVMNATKYHHYRGGDAVSYPEVADGETVATLTLLLAILDFLEAATSKRRLHNGHKLPNLQEFLLGIEQVAGHHQPYNAEMLQLLRFSL